MEWGWSGRCQSEISQSEKVSQRKVKQGGVSLRMFGKGSVSWSDLMREGSVREREVGQGETLVREVSEWVNQRGSVGEGLVRKVSVEVGPSDGVHQRGPVGVS